MCDSSLGAQNLSVKVLFMLVKSRAMVASKQTIYGKKTSDFHEVKLNP